MTNNTIPNVPRELLKDCLIAARGPINGNLAERLSALLSAPSPAGVEGLDVVSNWVLFDAEADKPYIKKMLPEGFLAFFDCEEDARRAKANNPGTDYKRIDRVKADDAQAIIDGLRGEVADLRSMLATVSKAGLRVRTERDHHARRISELETALEFACKSLAQVTSSDGSGHADIAVSVLRMAGTKEADALHVVEAYKAGAKWRVDSALSAGKEGE